MENFNLHYFKDELCRFRAAMGDRNIMFDPKKRENLLSGFLFVYFNTKTCNREEENFIQSMSVTLFDEFNNRIAFIDSP